MMDFLFDHGIDYAAKNKKGKTLLDLAISSRYKGIVEMLGGGVKATKKWYRRS